MKVGTVVWVDLINRWWMATAEDMLNIVVHDARPVAPLVELVDRPAQADHGSRDF